MNRGLFGLTPDSPGSVLPLDNRYPPTGLLAAYASLAGGNALAPAFISNSTKLIEGMTSTLSGTVAAGQVSSLVYLDFANQQAVGGAGDFYGILIKTSSAAVDTAAGIAVTNTGFSDNIYLGVAGAATACTPTGLGIDLNRSGSGEAGSVNAGKAIAIADWSVTDQGALGPNAIWANKQGNANSGHRLAILRGNQYLLELQVPAGAGFAANTGLMRVVDNGGAMLWQVDNGGSMYFAAGKTLFFNYAGGQSYIYTDGAYLNVAGSPSGVRFLDHLGASNVDVLDGGQLAFRKAGAFTTGAGSAALGANCPAATPAHPLKWLQVTLNDNSVGFVPVWQ